MPFKRKIRMKTSQPTIVTEMLATGKLSLQKPILVCIALAAMVGAAGGETSGSFIRSIETVPYNPNNASAYVYGGDISLTPDDLNRAISIVPAPSGPIPWMRKHTETGGALFRPTRV